MLVATEQILVLVCINSYVIQRMVRELTHNMKTILVKYIILLPRVASHIYDLGDTTQAKLYQREGGSLIYMTWVTPPRPDCIRERAVGGIYVQTWPLCEGEDQIQQ